MSSRTPHPSRLLMALVVLAIAAPLPGVLANDAKKAPEFAYADVNPKSATFGKTLSLSKLYATEGVVLNFIASWCPPCWLELPAFQKLDRESTTPVVLIAADEHGGPDDLLSRVDGLEVKLPILLVPPAEIASMEARYDHSMLPSTYMIDFQGRVRQVFQGMISEESLYRAASRHYPKSGIKAPARKARAAAHQ